MTTDIIEGLRSIHCGNVVVIIIDTLPDLVVSWELTGLQWIKTMKCVEELLRWRLTRVSLIRFVIIIGLVIIIYFPCGIINRVSLISIIFRIGVVVRNYGTTSTIVMIVTVVSGK